MNSNIVKSVKTYSHFVRFSKLTLSMMVIIVMVFVVAVPLIAQRGKDMRLAFAAIEDRDLSEQPAMINPQYQGLDDKNQPYKISAAKATQQDNDTILLEKISADLTSGGDAWLVILANEGLYNIEQGDLLLEGDVQLYHEAGHEIFTERVRINTKQMSAYGDSPVKILSNMGNLRADNFSIVERGNRLLFNKNVRMILQR